MTLHQEGMLRRLLLAGIAGDGLRPSGMSCPSRVHIVSADTKLAAPLGADYLESIGCGSVSLARDLYFQTP